jgi:hypothetical protein
MILLHYQSIDQIDWTNLLKTKKVIIFLPPIIIRELEKHKNFSGSGKIKKRASSALKKIHSFLDQGRTEIRSGVELDFIPKEPDINFKGYGLDKDISDDHLLASIIEYSYTNNGNVSLVTMDAGLKIKGKYHKINIIEIPDKYRLPEEIDPSEHKIKELERELSELRDRIPKLKLCFECGKNSINIKLGEHHCINNANEDLDVILSKYGQNYLEKYKIYLEELRQYNIIMAHTIKLNILIENYGTAPASDIDVYLYFSDSMMVFNEEEMLQKPSKPDIPSRTGLFYDLLGQRHLNMPNLKSLNFNKTIFDNVSEIDVLRNDSKKLAKVLIKKLKQNMSEAFDPLYIIFKPEAELIPFSIDYRINEESSPKDINGKLKINITNNSSKLPTYIENDF